MDLSNDLQKGASPVFRILNNPDLTSKLSKIINDLLPPQATQQIQRLIKYYDYRLVAEYLWSLINDKKRFYEFNRLVRSKKENLYNKILHKIEYQRFTHIDIKPTHPKIHFAKSFNRIFETNLNDVFVYLNDKSYKDNMLKLLNSINGSIGIFIEQQLDIPGRNALIRNNLVKAWHLPDGTSVVSKREGFQKNERFKAEQINHEVIRRMKQEIKIFTKGFTVQIAHPFALINDNGTKYSLFKKFNGETLEEILYYEKDKKTRRDHLINLRLILDELYCMGILWGDISPRNIIVDKSNNEPSYILVDFEKTKVFNKSVPKADRIEHARGQMFIEELCIICSLEEITDVFGDYFNPKKWNIKSKKILNIKVRPDIINLLKIRNITNINLGSYNKIDQEILEIKRPHTRADNHLDYFPGTIGFKVEHYLSCANDIDAGIYDSKITEILLKAKKQKLFDGVSNLLLSIAVDLECYLVQLEFQKILEQGVVSNLQVPRDKIKNIKNVIDGLYLQKDIDVSFVRN